MRLISRKKTAQSYSENALGCGGDRGRMLSTKSGGFSKFEMKDLSGLYHVSFPEIQGFIERSKRKKLIKRDGCCFVALYDNCGPLVKYTRNPKPLRVPVTDYLVHFIGEKKLVELRWGLKDLECCVEYCIKDKYLEFSCTIDDHDEDEIDFLPRWQPQVEKAFADFKKRFTLREPSVPKDLFDDVLKDLQPVLMKLGKEDVGMTMSKTKDCIRLAGSPDVVNALCREVERSIDKVNKIREEGAKETVTRIDDLKPPHYRLLKKINIDKTISEKFEGVKVKYIDKSSSGSIELTGQAQVVRPAARMVNDQCASFETHRQKFGSTSLAKFCEKPAVAAEIQKNTNAVTADTELKDGSVIAYAPSKGEAERAVRSVFETVRETDIPVHNAEEALVVETSPDWRRAVREIQRDHKPAFDYKEDKSGGKIRIVFWSLASVAGEIEETLLDCINRYAVFENEVKLNPGYCRFISKFKKANLDKIERELRQENIKIDTSTEKVITEGTKAGLLKAEKSLVKLFSDLRCDVHSVEGLGVQDHFMTGVERLSRLEENKRVVIEVRALLTPPCMLLS